MTQLITHVHNVYPFLLHPTQMRFPIGGECVMGVSSGILRSGNWGILARSLANVHCPYKQTYNLFMPMKTHSENNRLRGF